jgi:AcrR family transcriptional regulator
MPQVQKIAIRDAILDSAYEMFRENGYNETTMSQIAVAAGVSAANIYRYFSSKLEVFMAIYTPWLEERLDRLQAGLRDIHEPRARIERVLYALWQDLAEQNNNFANNFMQALSSVRLDEGYTKDLFLNTLEKVAGMIVPLEGMRLKDREDARDITHILLMAFDGFVMNYRLNGRPERLDRIIGIMADLVTARLSLHDRGDSTVSR